MGLNYSVLYNNRGTNRSHNMSERLKYLPALLGSGLSFLGAAAFAAGAAPEHAWSVALAAAIPGIGSALLNEFHKSFHEEKDEKRARRNHLVRRGMAKALHDVLISNRPKLEDVVPFELHQRVFEYWPLLLELAEKDDDLVDRLFPVDQSEDQWELVSRYSADFIEARQAADESEQIARVRARESTDRQAMSALLRNFPLLDEDHRVDGRFSVPLERQWSDSDVLAFAARLMPLYRISFATIFSQGGPFSEAVAYKGQKQTREQLENLDLQMQAVVSSLEKLVTEVGKMSGEVTDLNEKFTSFSQRIERLVLNGHGARTFTDSARSSPDAATIAADLARYRDWFARTFKLLKFLDGDLDAEQTVLDLPELSASIPKMAFDPPSKISCTPDQNLGDKLTPPLRDTSLGMKVADMLAMVTTGQACGYDFSTPGYVFIGESGLGKSSLLRRLAIESLEKNCLPIFIDWTSWYDAVKDEKHQRDKNLVKYIKDGQWLPYELKDIANPFLYAATAGYGILLILDGWDEVADDKLKTAELRDLLGQRDPQTTVLISTRPENDDTLKNTLVPIELGRISTEDCIGYLQRYVPAARSDVSLEQSIISSPYIGNGLLLTLVALSSKGQQDTVNLKNQAAIFEDYFASPSSRFLDSIKREKPQNKKGLLLLFQLLAFHATAVYDLKTNVCGRPVFPQDWVYKCSYYLAETHPHFKGLDAEDIARFAIQSSGVLAILGNNARFSHASLQDYYCGRAIAEYEQEKNEIDTLGRNFEETGNFGSPAISGVLLRNGINRVYQASCYESSVWLHRIRSLRGILGPFVEGWVTWIERPFDLWLLMDVEYVLKLIERVGDKAYIPLMNSALRIWRDPSKFDQSTVMKLYPYNAIAQLCVLNRWDDISTQLLTGMSSDEVQFLSSGIAGPVKKAFPRGSACRQHLQASLDELLTQAARQSDARRYRLLEVASFLEDYMERTLFEPVECWADQVQRLEIKRDPDMLRLFAVAARSNRFSSKLAVAAYRLLDIYLRDGVSITKEEGLHAPEALAGCVHCLRAYRRQTESFISKEEMKTLEARLRVLEQVFSVEQFREFLAEFARTDLSSQFSELSEKASETAEQNHFAVPAEWLTLLRQHPDPVWVLI